MCCSASAELCPREIRAVPHDHDIRLHPNTTTSNWTMGGLGSVHFRPQGPFPGR
jgi:hypothetical protein